MTVDQAALTAYLLDPCLSVNEARRMAAAASQDRRRDPDTRDVNCRPARPRPHTDSSRDAGPRPG